MRDRTRLHILTFSHIHKSIRPVIPSFTASSSFSATFAPHDMDLVRGPIARPLILENETTQIKSLTTSCDTGSKSKSLFFHRRALQRVSAIARATPRDGDPGSPRRRRDNDFKCISFATLRVHNGMFV
jgi:hypothetical protein